MRQKGPSTFKGLRTKRGNVFVFLEVNHCQENKCLKDNGDISMGKLRMKIKMKI